MSPGRDCRSGRVFLFCATRSGSSLQKITKINRFVNAFRSSFNEFSSKYGKDERFKNIEKMRERESLFNEFILEVRKREKEEKSHKRDLVIFVNFPYVLRSPPFHPIKLVRGAER